MSRAGMIDLRSAAAPDDVTVPMAAMSAMSAMTRDDGDLFNSGNFGNSLRPL